MWLNVYMYSLSWILYFFLINKYISILEDKLYYVNAICAQDVHDFINFFLNMIISHE